MAPIGSRESERIWYASSTMAKGQVRSKPTVAHLAAGATITLLSSRSAMDLLNVNPCWAPRSAGGT